MEEQKDITQSTKVSGIFTYFGEGKREQLNLNAIDMLTADVFFVQNKKPDELTQEEIMLNGTKMTVDNYDNKTGILKIKFIPSVPLWVFNNFAGYFIPVFETDNDGK